MPKRTLRRKMLDLRKSLSRDLLVNASRDIQQKFLATSEYRDGQTLALYASIHGEVDTSLIFAEAIAAGKKVVYPAVSGENMYFRPVASADELRSGAFGIPEPCADGQCVSPCAIDVVVVPGVAYDLDGRRVGYGKGYYDRCFHSMEGKGRLIGICFDFQLVDQIVGEPHDVMMDLVITERRFVRVRP